MNNHHNQNNNNNSMNSVGMVKIKKKETDPHVLLEKKLQRRNEKKMKKVSIDNVGDDEFKKLYFFDKDVVKSLHNKLLQVNSKIKEEYILWAISYLYFKHSHEKKALEYGVSRRTYQTRVWGVFRAISLLQPTRNITDRKSTSIKINQDDQYDDDDDDDGGDIKEDGYVSLVLDVAFFPFSNREAQYLGKQGPGLNYEIGFSPKDGEILYLNGPHPAAYQNIMIFREGYLYDIDFEKGEMVIGTKHHRGEPDKIITPYLDPATDQEKKFNEWIKSKRLVADKVMNIIKHFKISQTGWSSSIEKHQLAVSFLLYAINLSIIKDRGPDLLNETKDRNNDLFLLELKESKSNQNQLNNNNNNHNSSNNFNHFDSSNNNNNQLNYNSSQKIQNYNLKHQHKHNQYQLYNNNNNNSDYHHNNHKVNNSYYYQNQIQHSNIHNSSNNQYHNYHDNDDQVPTIDEYDSDDDGHFSDSDEETLDHHAETIFTKNHLNKPMFFCISNRAHIEKA